MTSALVSLAVGLRLCDSAARGSKVNEVHPPPFRSENEGDFIKAATPFVSSARVRERHFFTGSTSRIDERIVRGHSFSPAPSVGEGNQGKVNDVAVSESLRDDFPHPPFVCGAALFTPYPFPLSRWLFSSLHLWGPRTSGRWGKQSP